MTTSVGVSPDLQAAAPAERGVQWRSRLDGATSGSDSLAQISAAKAVPVAVSYWTDCLVLLQQGDVAAVSTDDTILDGLAAQDLSTMLVGPRLTDEPYGLAISKQHPEFVRFVNAVLHAIAHERPMGRQLPALDRRSGLLRRGTG